MSPSFQPAFDRSLCGKIRIASAIYTINEDHTGFVSAYTEKQTTSVTLSGWYQTGRSGKWLMSTNGYWIIEAESSAVGNTVEQHSDKDVQKLIDSIIYNNKRIYENNLLCAGCANRLTQEQRNAVRALQKRLEYRDAALRNSALIQSAQESYPAGYITYSQQLDKIVSGGTVGVVVSSTALIVISAVVVAAVSTAAYYAYMAYYNEAMTDVKFSDDLTAALVEKLTPEEYEQLKKETAGLITKAKITERFSGASSIIKYALIGTGAYMLYKFLKDKYNNSKK